MFSFLFILIVGTIAGSCCSLLFSMVLISYFQPPVEVLVYSFFSFLFAGYIFATFVLEDMQVIELEHLSVAYTRKYNDEISAKSLAPNGNKALLRRLLRDTRALGNRYIDGGVAAAHVAGQEFQQKVVNPGS